MVIVRGAIQEEISLVTLIHQARREKTPISRYHFDGPWSTGQTPRSAVFTRIRGRCSETTMKISSLCEPEFLRQDRASKIIIGMVFLSSSELSLNASWPGILLFDSGTQSANPTPRFFEEIPRYSPSRLNPSPRPQHGDVSLRDVLINRFEPPFTFVEDVMEDPGVVLCAILRIISREFSGGIR
jgi:hypothetical protein